jgi:hypothetical protein
VQSPPPAVGEEVASPCKLAGVAPPSELFVLPSLTELLGPHSLEASLLSSIPPPLLSSSKELPSESPHGSCRPTGRFWGNKTTPSSSAGNRLSPMRRRRSPHGSHRMEPHRSSLIVKRSPVYEVAAPPPGDEEEELKEEAHNEPAVRAASSSSSGGPAGEVRVRPASALVRAVVGRERQPLRGIFHYYLSSHAPVPGGAPIDEHQSGGGEAAAATRLPLQGVLQFCDDFRLVPQHTTVEAVRGLVRSVARGGEKRGLGLGVDGAKGKQGGVDCVSFSQFCKVLVLLSSSVPPFQIGVLREGGGRKDEHGAEECSHLLGLLLILDASRHKAVINANNRGSALIRHFNLLLPSRTTSRRKSHQ